MDCVIHRRVRARRSVGGRSNHSIHYEFTAMKIHPIIWPLLFAVAVGLQIIVIGQIR